MSTFTKIIFVLAMATFLFFGMIQEPTVEACQAALDRVETDTDAQKWDEICLGTMILEL